MDSISEVIKKTDIYLDGFNDEDAKELEKILKRFLDSYSKKKESLNDKEWLKKELKIELPSLSDEEANNLSEECFNEIEFFDKNLESINNTIENGGTKEEWLLKNVQEAAVGTSINDYGNYLNLVDISIKNANEQILRVITNNDGSVNKNMNLDGFIAEQHHVNSFNMNANLNKSKYRAEVLSPKAGETYGKNSFDVVIRDSNNKIIHQYQMKYGATAKETIKMIRHGNYNNQRLVVPPEQLEEVRKAFPGKTVESSIGGTDKVKITSKTLRKDEAKNIQLEAQKESNIINEDWNHFKTKELTINIAKNAGIAGIQAATITAGFDIAQRVVSNEKIDLNETLSIAFKTGCDSGIKAAATGALKVGIEKGIIKVIPQGTPIGVIANIVCVGIENVKVFGKVASGELTMTQALDRMGRITTSMVYGLGWGATASIIGAVALAWVPIVGPVIGGFIGGTIGYMAGSKFGASIYKVSKKIVNTAKKISAKAWSGVKSLAVSVKRKIFG